MNDWQEYGIELPHGAHGEVRTTCPDCSQNRRKKNDRCLAVNVEKGTWLCHHCGKTGGIKEEKTFYQPVKPPPKSFIKPDYSKTALPKNVVEWFAGREISLATLERYHIGYGPIFMPQANGKVNAIHFPYYRNGEVVNIKYRDGDKNFRMSKGAERILYGLNDINEFCTIIVEGELDKLTLGDAGFTNCVSVPDGAPSESSKSYSTKFSFLKSAEDQIGDVMKWVIAVDNDAPGVRLKEELIRRLGLEKCWIAEWPQGCKDANEVLVSHGKEALKGCINNATPSPVPFWG